VTRLRCAIYTRKSSEEGLEQSFNSLDAQREACEAYIASQKGEGWKALATRYDDGGYSGGNTNRPGLQRLLGDIAAGRVEVVVVYKVDRLSRALADFAKMVELFDAHGVSFVSVTQAFNTTSSMGRLTLNVLLSFAQFEREVTGERIRDKIAASKARGMWMGGLLPLGYEVKDRKLIVVHEEAETVRRIFARYLELKSVGALDEELREQRVRSKVREFADGRITGGVPFTRGALFHLLRNRIYVGEIVHRKQSYPGEHDGIVDPALFDRVQQLLSCNTVRRSERQASSAPLRGLVFDAAGHRMSPSHGYGRSRTKYRYYVSTADKRNRDATPGYVSRVSAALVEELVLDRLRGVLNQPAASWPELLPLLRRVEVRTRSIVLEFTRPPAWRPLKPDVAETKVELVGDDVLRLEFAACMEPRKGKTTLAPAARVERAYFDRHLIAALKRAHRELARHGIALSAGKADLKEARGLPDPYLRRIAALAFLAPDIQRAIVTGKQPPWLTLKQITDTELPSNWDEQRSRLGFDAHSS